MNGDALTQAIQHDIGLLQSEQKEQGRNLARVDRDVGQATTQIGNMGREIGEIKDTLKEIKDGQDEQRKDSAKQTRWTVGLVFTGLGLTLTFGAWLIERLVS